MLVAADQSPNGSPRQRHLIAGIQFLFMLVAFGFSTAANTQTTAQSYSQLQVILSGAGTYRRDNVPLRITFKTKGMPITLLNEFHDTPIPAFFSFFVTGDDGVPYTIPGAAKVTFGPAPLKYVEVNQKRPFTVTVQLDSELPKDLPPGAYDVSVLYHNQYGKDCYKGWTDRSEAIRIILK